MPLDLSEVQPTSIIRAAHVFQFFSLLTGAMDDQPVTLGNVLLLNNSLGLDITSLGSTPAAPGTGKTRLYHKTGSGWYFREGAAGAETAMVTPAAGSITPAMFTLTGAVAANTVLRGLSGTTMGFGKIVPGDFTVGTTTLVKVAEGVLASPAANVDISSIPSTYRHLLLLIYGRGDTAAVDTNIRIRFNNDTANNYDYQNSESVETDHTVTETFGSSSGVIGRIPANTAGAGLFGVAHIDIPAYAQATGNKAYRSSWGSKYGITTFDMTVGDTAGWWRNSAAINRITVFPSAGNFQTGTIVTLYGLPA